MENLEPIEASDEQFEELIRAVNAPIQVLDAGILINVCGLDIIVK